MSDLLYASRSNVSMVTATKKTLSLEKGAFRVKPIGLWSNAKCCLCQMLFTWAYDMISLIRQILNFAKTSLACFPGN